MNCYHHPDRPAVVICPVCGKGLCISCANESTVCRSCIQKKAKSSFNTALRYLIILLLLAIIGYRWDFLGTDTRAESGMSAYFLMSVCTGVYMLLGKLNFTSNTIFIFEAVSYGIFQILGLIFKIVICFAFGLIATPIIILWQIFILIKNFPLIYKRE